MGVRDGCALGSCSVTQYVFMSHRIKMAKPDGPVIICQQGAGGPQREADEFEILYRGQPIGRAVFDQGGLKVCDTHAVRAWVEFEDDVDIRPVVHAAPVKRKLKLRSENIIDRLTVRPGRRK